MKGKKSLSAPLKVNLWHGSTLTLHITEPLLGLGYIIVLPFVGFVSALFLVGYCVKQRIVAVGRRAVQSGRVGTS